MLGFFSKEKDLQFHKKYEYRNTKKISVWAQAFLHNIFTFDITVLVNAMIITCIFTDETWLIILNIKISIYYL